MKAVLGYTAAVLKIWTLFKTLYMEKNNVDFERLIRQNFGIYFNKSDSVELTSDVLFCPLGYLR